MKFRVIAAVMAAAAGVVSGAESAIESGMSAVTPAVSLATFKTTAAAHYEALLEWFADHAELLLFSIFGLVVSYFAALLLRWLFTGVFIGLWHHRVASPYYEQTMRAIRRPLTWIFFTVGALLSVWRLTHSVSPGAAFVAVKCAAAAATLLVVWMAFRLLEVFYRYLLERPVSDHAMNLLLVNLLRKIVKAVILLLALFFIGQNIFGLNISALLAGAGVVGLAIALAAQDTLANFFGSIMILADKPFNVGDRVRFGAIDGTVESVGFRSTRIRALDGNIFQVPNRQLVDGVLENISRRPDIKYAFDLGLVYQTTPEQMEQALAILRELLDRHPAFDAQKHPPLINFTEFRDWSLNIAVVVWFDTIDFAQAQQWKTQINLEILRRFNNAGLTFAYPTATHFLTTAGAAPVEIKGRVALKSKDSEP